MLNRILWKIFIFFYVFVSSCTSSPNQEGRAEIETFLKRFMFQEGGIYTLFGDKPMTDLLVFHGTSDEISLEGLSDEVLNQILYVEDSTQEEWEVWKQFSKDIQYKTYRFIELMSPFDPSYGLICLIHVDNLKHVFETHKEAFKNRLGETIEFDQILSELEKRDSSLWRSILLDHYLSGLVHGYSEESIQEFMAGSTNLFTVEQEVPPDSMRLPIYSAKENDSFLERYREQREKCRKIYKNKNFLKITLNKLQT